MKDKRSQSRPMNRRLFLGGVGGATLATPFLASLEQRPLRAQTAPTDPRRLVIFYTNNGCITNRWFPKLGGPEGTVTAESLSGGTLAPLADKASKLLFPRGLRMALNSFSIDVDGVNHFDPHDQGMGSKLTCAPLDPGGDHYALSHSLDHEVAQMFNQGTNKSPLVLSVGFGGTGVKQIVSYSASRTPYPAETNAQNVYTSLTGLFVGDETEADYRVARGESIIDLVSDDLQTYKRLNMSMSDQKKIDDWLDLLRSTENRIIPAACNQVSADGIGLTADSVPSGGFGGGVNHENAEVMLRLIALTMMCDNNRSIIMQWPGYSVFEFLGHTIDHHGLSHRVGSAATSGTCVSGVLDRIREIDDWFAGRYAELVNLLDSIEEGTGTMLDNTACMWLPELADGNAHNNNNLPIVIAGSCGGYLKQGVSINVDGGSLGDGENQTGDSESACQSEGEMVSSTSGTGSNGGQVPLNKLYTTLINALGAGDPDFVPIDRWGVSDAGGGGFGGPGIDFTTDGAGNVTDGPGISNPGELDSIKA